VHPDLYGGGGVDAPGKMEGRPAVEKARELGRQV